MGTSCVGEEKSDSIGDWNVGLVTYCGNLQELSRTGIEVIVGRFHVGGGCGMKLEVSG